MKLRNKKMTTILVVSSIILGALSVGAAQATKQIQVHYDNIKVDVNGQNKATKVEPFKYNNSVYVGLRDMGEMLSAQVDWDPITQTVKLTTEDTNALKMQINTLKQELEEAQVLIAKYEEQVGAESQIDVKKMEKKLQDRYNNKYGVNWIFELTGNQDGLALEVKFDNSTDNYAFGKMTRDSVRTFIREICKYVEKEISSTYDIQGIKVKGKLYELDEMEVYAEFESVNKTQFTYEWVKSETIDPEELELYEKIINNNFNQFPYVNMRGYDAGSINIKRIHLEEQMGEVVYRIYTTLDEMGRPYWNALNLSDVVELEKYMEKIRVELKAEFNVDVQGYIYDEDQQQMARYNGKLSLN